MLKTESREHPPTLCYGATGKVKGNAEALKTEIHRILETNTGNGEKYFVKEQT